MPAGLAVVEEAPVEVVEGPDPWERQKGESRQAFQAFVVYRDMNPKRSLRRTAQVLEKSPSLIARWSSRWFWQNRIDRWDDFQDEKKRNAQLEVITKMSERHAGVVQSALTILSMPVREAIKRFQQDPTILEMMELDDVLKLAVVCSKNIPTLVQTERLTRGASTENIEQHVKSDNKTVVKIEWNDEWRMD